MRVIRSFKIYEAVDYKSLMELFDEYGIKFQDVKTVDYQLSRVIGEGEERYVDFVEYLHNKYLERMTKMRNSLKLSDKKLEGKEENDSEV